ncbi:hypothetical protein COO60DRAFT_671384 [Scenedesmus sp. NREL 46B-D3]|nr:hypothetical protein COO60DRAFT_671384 [Scenedesmus sp. NREL 46B-D3]
MTLCCTGQGRDPKPSCGCCCGCQAYRWWCAAITREPSIGCSLVAARTRLALLPPVLLVPLHLLMLPLIIQHQPFIIAVVLPLIKASFRHPFHESLLLLLPFMPPQALAAVESKGQLPQLLLILGISKCTRLCVPAQHSSACIAAASSSRCGNMAAAGAASALPACTASWVLILLQPKLIIKPCIAAACILLLGRAQPRVAFNSTPVLLLLLLLLLVVGVQLVAETLLLAWLLLPQTFPRPLLNTSAIDSVAQAVYGTATEQSWRQQQLAVTVLQPLLLLPPSPLPLLFQL